MNGGGGRVREDRRRIGRPSTAVVAAGLLLTFAAGFIPAAHGASLEVYGRLPHLEDVALSPDGTRIAFVRTDAETRTVAVVGAAKGERLVSLRVGDQKLRGLEWADDDHLIIETSVTTMPQGLLLEGFRGRTGEWFQLQIYDLKTAKLFMVPEPTTATDLQLLNVIAGPITVRRIKDHTVIFFPGVQTGSAGARKMGNMIRQSHVLERSLIRVDLDSHYASVAQTGKRGALSWWALDGEGDVAAEETYEQHDGHWALFIRHAGEMQRAATGSESVDLPRILGLGPTADTVLVETIEDGDSVWRLLSLADGSIGSPMAAGKELDRPIEDRVTHRMVGGVHVGDSAEYQFFDPQRQAEWTAVLRAFPNEHVYLTSASSDFRKLIVRVEGAKDGYGFELVDLDKHGAEPIGDVYAGVSQPFEVRRITYAAADGLEIPAYLTLPRGKPPTKLPLIVLPHGGPAVRDTADFDWWSQALADQGYAVLRPNYRGSALGFRFVSRGFGEWGRKMQTDLSDGVRYLAREGIVDPARVCIVGGSYGGYAALAGVSLDAGVYRCAVTIAGISDIPRMLAWSIERHRGSASQSERYWDRFMGLNGPNDPAADAISPIKHLDAITVPVLLIHGKDDTVVPFEQSEVMYDALRGAKKDVQLVTLKGEDHWLSRSETRLQMLEASVEFLRAHNPPD